MEEKINREKDCGCSDNCCQPAKKSNLLSRIIFIAVILAVIAIVAVKLTGKSNAEHPVVTDTTNVEQVLNIDTTGTTTCEKPCKTDGNSSCCPKPKK
jgi:hypothetical protein